MRSRRRKPVRAFLRVLLVLTLAAGTGLAEEPSLVRGPDGRWLPQGWRWYVASGRPYFVSPTGGAQWEQPSASRSPDDLVTYAPAATASTRPPVPKTPTPAGAPGGRPLPVTSSPAPITELLRDQARATTRASAYARLPGASSNPLDLFLDESLQGTSQASVPLPKESIDEALAASDVADPALVRSLASMRANALRGRGWAGGLGRLADARTGQEEDDASLARREDLAWLQGASRANQLAGIGALSERVQPSVVEMEPTEYQEVVRRAYEEKTRRFDRVFVTESVAMPPERAASVPRTPSPDTLEETLRLPDAPPALRRWHARPLFDTRVYERGRVRETLSGGQPTRRLLFGASERSALAMAEVRTEALQEQDRPTLGPLRLEGWGATPVVSWGGSTASDAELKALQAGQYDPTSKFFHASSIAANLDVSVFRSVGITSDFEVIKDREGGGAKVRFQTLEAWASDPESVFAVHVGQFATPFGVDNMRYPVDRFFLDAPIVRSRLMGPVGLFSDLGAGFAWQPPRSGLRLHVGAQNAYGDKIGEPFERLGMESFLSADDTAGRLRFEQRSGGHPWVDRRADLFSRALAFGRVQADVARPACRIFGGQLEHAAVGGSVAFGPNATGTDGNTLLLGLDAYFDGRRPLPRGATPADYRPDWIWQTEVMLRRFHADGFFEANMPGPADDVFLPEDNLYDWGLYSQYLRAVSNQVGLGVRFGYVTGEGDSVTRTGVGAPFLVRPRSLDPFRDDRWRASGLLIWNVGPKLRVRLEYSVEDADHLGGLVHSVWVSFDGQWKAEATK
jgi:hypothetical protein